MHPTTLHHLLLLWIPIVVTKYARKESWIILKENRVHNDDDDVRNRIAAGHSVGGRVSSFVSRNARLHPSAHYARRRLRLELFKRPRTDRVLKIWNPISRTRIASPSFFFLINARQLRLCYFKNCVLRRVRTSWRSAPRSFDRNLRSDRQNVTIDVDVSCTFELYATVVN